MDIGLQKFKYLIYRQLLILDLFHFVPFRTGGLEFHAENLLSYRTRLRYATLQRQREMA